MKLLHRLIMSLFLLVLTAEAQTNRFNSTQGFSFEYPQKWVVATKEQQIAASSELKSAFKQLGDINFDRIAAVVFNPADDGFIESVNVVITQGSIPVNEDSRQKHIQAVTEQLRNAGVKVTDIKSELTRFGEHQALSLQQTLNDPSGNGLIRQWQIAMPGRNQTYIITATARVENFPTYEASFKKIFESFEVDGGSLGFWHGLPGWVQNALIGAGIGALIGMLGSLFKKMSQSLNED